MTVEEAAAKLTEYLRHTDGNFQCVAIRKNNVEAFNANPERFNDLIKEDCLVVYTYRKPTRKELHMHEYEGFAVSWCKMGRIQLG
jgi:hypothetical protein